MRQDPAVVERDGPVVRAGDQDDGEFLHRGRRADPDGGEQAVFVVVSDDLLRCVSARQEQGADGDPEPPFDGEAGPVGV
ncbi:hypothetical protein ACIA5D_00165 [Actinoplanes sp. NPDC051513]|uniref:hypothetical protein n=1 Tax=Actinoplanes sp. NPDC051513 TaxID=3363908 RepID=UPI0037B9CCC9